MAQFNLSPMNTDQMIKMMQMMVEQAKPLLQAVGIDLGIDRIILHPSDGDCIVELSDGSKVNLCIDIVWRIRCQLPNVCNQLREMIKQEYG